MKTETQKTETHQVTRTGIKHYCDPPYTHGLCGAPIRKMFPADTTIDCVVCAELDAAWGF